MRGETIPGEDSDYQTILFPSMVSIIFFILKFENKGMEDAEHAASCGQSPDIAISIGILFFRISNLDRDKISGGNNI